MATDSQQTFFSEENPNRQKISILAPEFVAGYVYGDDLISQERGGTKSYYHYDGLGSTRALTDDRGAATDTYNYEAFGTLLHQTGTTGNDYLFTGEQYDPNAGFYYLRARWMNPETGRFITTDPFEGVQNDPVTLHKYLYAGMNPVMLVDPSGEFSLGSITTGMAISSVLVSTNLSVVTGILHLIDYKKPVKWEGEMLMSTYGKSGIGGGGVKVKLESKCKNGEKAKGKYLLVLFGFTVGLPFPDISESLLEVTTPGILGLSPKVLQGHCLWSSASLVGRFPSGAGGGFHTSFSSLYMGAGIAEIAPPFEAEWGYDVGLDFMGGISIGLPGTLKENIPCS